MALCRVAQSEFRKILRFRIVAEKVPHSAQPKVGGGGVVAELSTKKSVDSSKNRVFFVENRDLESAVVAEPSKKTSVDSAINHYFVRILKQAIQIRRKRIFP